MLAVLNISQEKYLDGHSSFVVSPDDNPDCVPFYRAWAGMTAVLGKETMNRWHHMLHEALCTASYKPLEEQYTTAVEHLRYMVDRWQQPERPRMFHSYACSPSEPTEQEAREFFNVEYKRAFPDKRANSKHANGLWIEKREQAMAILREQYNARLADHETREREHDARNQRTMDEWIDKFRGMAEFEQFVRTLEGN